MTTTTIYDWYRRAWRTVELIDLGRKQPVDAADPDAAMQPDRLPGMAAHAGIKHVLTHERIQRLREHILRHGPVTIAEMAEILGVAHPSHWIKTHGKDLFHRVGFLNGFALYGLKDNENE